MLVRPGESAWTDIMRRTHLLLLPVAAMCGCSASFAQRVQNSDISFLAGPAPSGSRALGGSDVTVNGRTALGTAVGYGYQLTRMSAASIWFDFSIGTNVTNGITHASIQGSVNNDIMAYTAGARLMLPLQSRVSGYGSLAGGGGTFQYAVINNGSNPYVSSNSTAHGVLVIGGGIDVRLTRRISIRGEVRDLVTGTGLSGASGRHHVLPLFGIAFHF